MRKMTRSSSSIRRIRRQRHLPMIGYLVTWDVDSRNPALCSRLSRFVFGYEIAKNGKTYRYPGFVEREGVRYIGQSVLFVTTASLGELRSFLSSNRIDHVVTNGSIGSIMHS